MKTKKDSAEAFIELLADGYARAIMSMTFRKECSALELSQELDIPLATVYRRLKLLEDSMLIQNVQTIITLSGNEEKYYRCVLREATVRFRNGELSISLDKENYSDGIVRLWKRLARPEN
ncbi:putative transcriptional regulator [Candidatus Methanoperedens nitroreducens]|uniref:Putative transcriptional regulator n=1 Tax=Candidatus Methanoperedens nitratireducens TaxID=1392998 RepID=A0A062V5Z6_9EURY|nr:helix-turn-helix domain-containing protein [Candidatus Methanoperedens nitroreducens]KCZ70820.1 putative transcriptional regulator [Candidatus Methanoperedens nitroreducens]MDJ1420674.1 helix-turn-helix domain-containing protein [Candidatus Methanoperedens sp.]